MEYEYDIAPASPFQEKYLNNTSRWLIVGGAMGCVDMDTEYLGENGWRKVSDYANEMIYIHNPLSGQVTLEYPEYIKEMGDVMYHLKSDKIDMVLSPNHKTVYYKHPLGNPIITDTSTLIKHYNNNEDVVGFVKSYDGVSLKDVEMAGYTIEEYIPKDRKQYCFRTSTGTWVARRNGKCFITGNSSKSYIGLMRHLKYIHDPKYVGLIIRKELSMITGNGGLWEEALPFFQRVDPNLTFTKLPRRITFSNGAKIEFTHYAKNKFQGLNVDTAFYDEVTHAEEEDVYWIYSRIRNASSNIKDKCLWMSCNPDHDSWVLKYVLWYLYPEGHPKQGLPDPEKNGIERYMIRKEGKVYFADTKKELIEQHGIPDLPEEHPAQISPITFTVLLGTIFDNPVLLKKSPEYLASLKAMPEIEMRRNLLGDWFARPQGCGYFDRSWVEEVVEDVNPNDVICTYRAYDFAGTLRSDVNPSPDYTACAKISKLKDGRYIIRDVKRTRIRFGDWKTFIIDNAAEDMGEYPQVEIVLPIDPNPSAKGATLMLARDLISEGVLVKTQQSTKSKLDSFRPFSAMAQNEGVLILKDCVSDLDNNTFGNDILYKELEQFDGLRSHNSKKDDRQTCRL